MTDNIKQGLELMITGMGTVAFFLLLLVGVMMLSGSLFRHFAEYFPENEPETKTVAAKPLAKIAAAIAAAEHARRSSGLVQK